MASVVLASSFSKLAASCIGTVSPSVAPVSLGHQNVALWSHAGCALDLKEHTWRRGPKTPCCTQAASSEATPGSNEGPEVVSSPATFEEFVQLNLGSWRGSFTQFDIFGSTLQCIQTKVSSNSYGKGEQCSLYQTLYVEQPRSMYFSGEDDYVPPWADFKLDDITYETFNKRPIIYYPGASAYTISHQTAEVLDKVLRAGVIGEDNDDEDESPKGVKLPSRRPALVSESCLYSEDGEDRLRAFHVLDPRGFVDLIGIFREHRETAETSEGCSILFQESAAERLQGLVGRWSGRAVTQRSGIYGSTFREGNVSVEYETTEGKAIYQRITSDYGLATRVDMVGTLDRGLILFEGGLQTVLLPGGVSLTCPVTVGRSVGKSQAFYFEFAWSERPGYRRRLVRTFDTDGLVVSTTLSTETKAQAL